MGYISKIDRSATIKAAKKELNEFAVLLTLSRSYGTLSSVDFTRLNLDHGFMNYDELLLENIEAKDEKESEIEKVLLALNALSASDVEILWMKHVNSKTNNEISSDLYIEKSTFYRKLNSAYISFAIAYNIVVFKER